jgi:hypothetical protein
MAGAPVGNQNAANGKKWRAAIDRALETRSRSEGREILDALADELINQALAGEQWAFQQLGDRLDGKVAQGVELSGPGGGPVQTVVNFVAASNG